MRFNTPDRKCNKMAAGTKDNMADQVAGKWVQKDKAADKEQRMEVVSVNMASV
ncbi:unnamed protein product [Phyllotreta striolata]|uniref:Uncharacterized protein n=1 Tax=Phyllotreta striolata TaxID=444603 RepID=A0A9N9TH59_PHYSR|nr:unnamed protein product [Phyllotreta striolata]